MHAPTASLPLRLLTLNIRYATSTPSPNELPWPDRYPPLLSLLHYHSLNLPPTFLCLQEVLHTQLLDLLSGLNSRARSSDPTSPSSSSGKEDEWAYIGVGRDDGAQAGEYSPIFYRPSVWELKHADHIWLSETPERPSRGWDAASIRILTIGVFKHRVSRKIVLVLNTHLDDQGVRARREAAGMILRVVEEVVVKGRVWSVNGVVVAGDLNSEVGGGAWRVLNRDGYDEDDGKGNGEGASSLVDLRRLVTEEEERYGNENTFTGFGDGERKKRIDFLHLGPRRGKGKDDGGGKGKDEDKGKDKGKDIPNVPWRVQSYGVLENRFDDGVYLSDHRAVVGDVLLE